jgi:hypothetical protein
MDGYSLARAFAISTWRFPSQMLSAHQPAAIGTAMKLMLESPSPIACSPP